MIARFYLILGLLVIIAAYQNQFSSLRFKTVVMTTHLRSKPIGMLDIVNAYDVFLLDQWGVLHNGKIPYEGVLQTLIELKNRGKCLLLLSNSSRREEESRKGLLKVGIDPSIFDEIVTSGELCWVSINNRASGLLGSLSMKSSLKVWICGNGDDDASYVQSCGCELGDESNADFILARGTFATVGSERSITYSTSSEFFLNIENALKPFALKKTPMIVSNPDMMRPGTNDPMPGKIADIYRDLCGGSVDIKYIGKPYDFVYNHCFQSISKKRATIERSKICGVGDSLEHDIKGAISAGIDSVWIMNGVHCKELNTEEGSPVLPSSELIDQLIQCYDIQPTIAIPSFSM